MEIRADEISQIIRKRIEDFDKEVQIAETGTVTTPLRSAVVAVTPTSVPIGASGASSPNATVISTCPSTSSLPTSTTVPLPG